MGGQKYIFGNWKMAQDLEDGEAFVRGWDHSIKANVTATIFPSSVHIHALAQEVSKHGLDLNLGAQDCSPYEKGAHTGEVSARMLFQLACTYVLLGHSERRARGDTDELIEEKLHRAQNAGLVPVLCVGESEEERKEAKVFDRLSKQISALKKVGRSYLVAYEPIWAIGTGLTPTEAQIQEVHEYLVRRLPEAVDSQDPEIRCLGVLYGGSVKASNAAEILRIPGVNGLLIGGASLALESFKNIVEIAGES